MKQKNFKKIFHTSHIPQALCMLAFLANLFSTNRSGYRQFFRGQISKSVIAYIELSR